MNWSGLHLVLIWLFIIWLDTPVLAQNRLYMPLQRQNNLPIQHDIDTLGSLFHPGIFPYQIRDIDSSQWFLNVYHGNFFTDKLFLELHVNKKSKKNPVKISITPIGELLTGFESGLDAKTFLQTGIGVNFSAMIGNRFDININISGSNSSFPSFVESFAFIQSVIPGQGYAFHSNLGYYYNNSYGYVSYQAGKYFNLTAGRGKNKFGEGYRSLMLSDAGNNYNYFRVITNIWRIKYVNLFTQMNDIYMLQGAPKNHNKKYSSMHYFSVNIAKRWNVGLFESIQWAGKDSLVSRRFDPYYLNPIIFYRPVEFSLGSADNVLMGLHVSCRISKQVKLYSQVVIDEFKLNEIKGSKGWWGNKYAIQGGVKYYDAFGIERLSIQSEYNMVRPYMYSHRTPTLAYGYDNQPIAHPSGANFHEGVILANYYINKFYIELKSTLTIQGIDSDSISYGANIFKSYELRPADYGNTIGQGTQRFLSTTNLKASFLLNAKANIRIEANLSNYTEIINGKAKNIFWPRIGIRTGMFNEDWDF